MKLTKSTINTKQGTGAATLLPQEPEDMWHAYNLIRPTDIVRAVTFRKVVQQTNAMTDARNIQTKRTTVSIRVEKLDYDAQIGELKVNGRVSAENEFVEMGAYHTLKLEVNRQFTLEKGEEGSEESWDTVALETLRDATDVKKAAQCWAVVLSEGMANICLLTENQTLLRQRVEMSIPRKRVGHGADAHDKGMEKFYSTTLSSMLRQMDFEEMIKADAPPPLILASPGFTAGTFLKYVQSSAWQKGDKSLTKYAKESVLVVHTSSGHLHSLSEALKQPAVISKLRDTKYGRETQLMERFMALLRQDDGRAWYGPQEVIKAVEQGAVGRGGGVLLISNQLFRSDDIAERKRWVALVERVRQVEGGEVRVLSSAHESGKKLEGLGNIGAILTYPIPDLDEDGDELDDG